MSEKAKVPSRRRTSRIHVPGDPAPAASPEVIHEAVAEAAPDLVEAPEADLEEHDEGASESANGADGDGAPVAKRKTRRGSRGGRNHRKKPVVAGETEDVVGTEAQSEADGETALAVATVLTDDDTVEEVPAVAAATAPSVADERSRDEPTPEKGEAGYVPMSEWLDDFDRR